MEILFIEFNLNFSYLALDRKGGGDVCFGKATAYDSTNDTHRGRNGRFNVNHNVFHFNLIVFCVVMYVAFRFVSQEEVVLKRCWLARYWGLCFQHGIVILPFVQILNYLHRLL